MWARWATKRAARRCLKRLPRRLKADYGHRGPFNPAQIEMTIRRSKAVPLSDLPYALAIFGDPELVREVWRELDLRRSYDALRADIGSGVFSSGDGFTQRDVDRYGVDHAWGDPGHFSGGGEAGHHGDGGGGGGHH